jgi:flagellar biosynthesis protein FlhG
MANLGTAERTRLFTAVDEVAHEFDVMIVDTGAGIGSNSVSFASSVDEVLLVTTPDPTALRDAYAMTKVLHKRSGVDRISLVANQVRSAPEGAEIHEKLKSIIQRFMAVELEYLGYVSYDTTVRHGCATGEPFVLAAPQSAPAREMAGIARRIAAGISAGERC